ncbi:MAG: histidine kinase [Veillonellaceae bacterium]|nr:histidine kinase [Veillonellaceae bacterium]
MHNVDISTLDKIVKKTISSIRDSRGQIYDVYEMARDELETVKRDVERIKEETAVVIQKVDELERKERKARIHLMEVSRDFKNRTEEEVREAYEAARKIQIDVAVTREQEQNLRRQRDELEVRLRNLGGTVAKAEQLVSQVGVVLDYLGTQMSEAFSQIETLQNAHALGAQVIRSQEEERRRVARDIHDGPAQAIANIVFRAEVCERLIDTDAARAKAELKALREHIRNTLTEIRKIIFDLRPMALDDLGLAPTIRGVLDVFREQYGLITEIAVTGKERRLEPHIEIGIFRVVQEALNNIVKHAQATSIRVRLEFAAAGVTVLVEDDGKGFEMTEEELPSGHYGIMGMRERMQLLNGKLTIKSAPRRGTRVTVSVPLE